MQISKCDSYKIDINKEIGIVFKCAVRDLALEMLHTDIMTCSTVWVGSIRSNLMGKWEIR